MNGQSDWLNSTENTKDQSERRRMKGGLVTIRVRTHMQGYSCVCRYTVQQVFDLRELRVGVGLV
jgi:hypothetical protein